ncbi:hypothetical protein FSP39_008532 [Pinctada imbricata]|uniref:Amine oxidase domain-containing protein n=1 Tax=Pinctada imbricata TaxID=66713 RepID=A0AA88YEC0_PINIB|nr:hypothetical protein FSP39_008532 [Pinctada imbricata]
MSGKPQVIIIGAGISGLAAAEKLTKFGFHNYKILEASDRIGGRIHTVEDGNPDEKKVELGATWIHGQKKNPVFELAKTNKLIDEQELKKQRKRMTVYVTEEGETIGEDLVDKVWDKLEQFSEEADEFFESETPYPDINESYGAFLQQRFDKFLQKKNNSEREKMERVLLNEKSGECAYSGCDSVDELSLKYFGSYEELSGKHVTFGRGYSSLLEVIKRNIPDEKIILKRPVKTIHWGKTMLDEGTFEVKVECQNGECFYANHIIVTVSLGVLKAHHNTLFNPCLPSNKQQAIDKLGFGTVDKVILFFDEPVLGRDIGCLSLMWSSDKKDLSKDGKIANWCRKMSELTAVYGNAILGWVTGKEALEMEKLSEDEVTENVMTVLRTFLRRDDLPTPVKLIRTRWGNNPSVLGSYSFVKVGSSTQDIRYLREPTSATCSEKPVLLFAGEATHESFYSTTHGAFLSGQREAQRILDLYKNI